MKPPRAPAEMPEDPGLSGERQQADALLRLQRLRQALREVELAAARQALTLAAACADRAREQLFSQRQQVQQVRGQARRQLAEGEWPGGQIRRWVNRDAFLLRSLEPPRAALAGAESDLAEAERRLAARLASWRQASRRCEKLSALADALASD